MCLWCFNCCFKRSGRVADEYTHLRHDDYDGSVVTVTSTSTSRPKSKTHDKDDKESFFVITAIFNPCSYQRRYDLYHNFAQHMKDTGAQLITIECIFPSLNQQEFQVTEENNPFHIQLLSNSVYWMKENLINIAVCRLPPHAKWVAWLDADIHFHANNWIHLTLQALQNYSVVQLFETVEFLGPGPENTVLRIDHSFGYSAVNGKPIDQSRYSEWYPHPGYGWAMSINTYKLINGLPEYDIVGSGDLHFAFALIDKVHNAIEKDLNPQFKNLILAQSKDMYKKLCTTVTPKSPAIVGYVPGLVISHHWHGSRKNRQYVDRWKILIAHNFNYARDVRKNSDGLLELIEKEKVDDRAILRSTNTGVPTTTLQNDIISYFRRRNEDEDEFEIEDNLLESNAKKKKEKNAIKRSDAFDNEDGGGDTSSSAIVEIAIAMMGIANTFCDEPRAHAHGHDDTYDHGSHDKSHAHAPRHERTHGHGSQDKSDEHEQTNDHSKSNHQDVHNYENHYNGQVETTSHY